ncbi:MAG: endonuclease MutS2 [Lachnospiraceae bacterium]|nr:endonuclease MutS2 [Lachnospiraceae bacterium]
MDNKALRVLEYNKIIDLLTEKASSDPGRELCKSLTPLLDLEEIQLAQTYTKDALSRLFKKGSTSFGGNRDLTYICKHLEVGGSLNAIELLQIAALLENVARVKSFGRMEGKEFTDSLDSFFEQLEPLTQLSSQLRRCILSEDEIADDASSNLRHIRRQMTITGDKIHSQLNSMVNGSYRTYLQDAVITMRDNRYCIPVKAEYKNQVSGMVHDQSGSGSTLFIEPSAIIDLNNKLKELSLQEKEEIEKILRDLSILCSEHTLTFKQNAELMTFLDFTFAKASLALEQNATEPIFNERGYINIRKGRHPLLKKDKVVPIDIYLGDAFSQLIITGPNTGGKTVSLKTVGLFTLMGQSGLHIPALDRSELGIFTNVFADIGDEQSIEQSLSTFSSHMTNIVHILKEADSRSLCLFDELCAGTDPTEGAALAIAILENLKNRGASTMATTHYSELKVYALSKDHVENACCEFNVETLSPTYRLLIGIPGKSNAFAISGKLGLSDNIIENAKKQLSTEEESFEDLLSDLEKSRVIIEKEQLEIQTYKQEIEALKKQLEAKQDKIEASRERILREANEEAREILQDAKAVADETIRSFQKYGSNTSMKEMEQKRNKVREKISEKNSKLSLKAKETPKGGLNPNQIKLGDSVKVLSMNVKGTISSKPDAKGMLFVQCGIIRSKVHISDLIPVLEEDIKAPNLTRARNGRINVSKASNISPEINLLGKTVDEAIAALDKYLDDAYVTHLPSVRIVHGKGTGALRNAVQNHLKKLSYIKSFRLGEFGEGDAGVTIAEFK